jgi:aspartate/methionine/tyrosine aminotransferase
VAALFWTKWLIRTGLARWLPSVRRSWQSGTAFLHYFSDTLLTSPYEELARLAQFLDMPEPDGIDLALGAPRLDLFPATMRLPLDRRGYPPAHGLPELRQAIGETLQTLLQISLRPHEELLVTHGAAGAFNAAVAAFVNPGDNVVLLDPTSQLFPLVLRQRRANIRWVPTWMEEGRLRFRLQDLAKALRRARLLVLASPNNPNGAVLGPGDLEPLAWWAKRRDVLIFQDTSLALYQYEGRPAALAPCPLAADRTLTAGSVSKSHGLTSARVGWLAGHRHLVKACTVAAALHVPFVPVPAQLLALQALHVSSDALAVVRSDFAARRQYVHDRLRAMGLTADWPAGGFFAWVRVQSLGLTGAECARQLLQEHKVLTWPGEFFGPSGVDHIRLSFAADEGRLTEGLRRLAAYVRCRPAQAVPARPHSLPTAPLCEDCVVPAKSQESETVQVAGRSN